MMTSSESTAEILKLSDLMFQLISPVLRSTIFLASSSQLLADFSVSEEPIVAQFLHFPV